MSRGGARVLVLVLALSVCAFAAVSGAAGAASAPTVEQVYANAGRSLIRPGHVYHLVITRRGGSDGASKAQWWVDARRDVVREQNMGGSSPTHASLIVDGGLYEVPGVTGQALTCFGASASVGAVLGCPGPSDHSNATVSTGDYGGRSVVVLTTAGSRSAEDSNTLFTRHLYLDPKTFLPVAADEQGKVDTGTIRRYRLRTSYRGGFVPVSSLPADFFDPAAQGFTKPGSADLLHVIPPGTTLYWLGNTFTPGANLPPSTLSRVEAGQGPGSGPGYVAILYYTLASDPFGLPDLSIQVWPRAAWDDPSKHFDLTPCPGVAPITLGGGGTATIVCPPGAADPVAVVNYPDTVLMIGFSFRSNPNETAKPYASTDAINIVLDKLEQTST